MSRSQNTFAGLADMLGGAVKHSPEALLLLAAGCALLMRSRPANGFSNRSQDIGGGSARAGSVRQPTADVADRAREYSSGVADRAHEYTSDVADRAREYGSDVADRARETAGSYASVVSDYADQARETAGSYASAVSDYADQARRTLGDQSQQALQQTQSALQGTLDRVLKDQPLVVAFAGLAVGAALAASLPTTEAEKETLGPVGQRVSDAAVHVGERLKDAASEATDTLKQSAERRGLSAGGLKEMASEAAGAFSGRMTEGAGSDSAEGSRAGATQVNKMPGA